jgi:sigma-E factor negative regulatory protein RseA
MSKELSALLDGELDEHELPVVWSQLRRSEYPAKAWGDYKLIGDAMRGDSPLTGDISAGVMSRLSDEPVILVPRGKQANDWQGRLLALAASAAGIGIVAWLALAPPSPVWEPTAIARIDIRKTGAPDVRPSMPEYREYLLAHQANAPGLHMQGGAQHIRTVSAMGEGQ